MAIQTFEVSRFGGQDEGRVYALYDDVTLRATGVRVVNPTIRTVRVLAVRPNDRREYSATFGPGSDTTLDIPTNPSGRINITFNTELQRLDGIEVQTLYPWFG